MCKCHICEMEAPLNVLLARHANKHIAESYSKENYKRELLIATGRIPKICPVCNKETSVPKGEKEFPQYHKKCYLQHMVSSPENNPNYSCGKQSTECAQCKTQIIKHATQLMGKNKFCSTACSTAFYCRPENQTPAVTQRLHNAKLRLEANRHDPIVKRKIAIGQAAAYKDGRSNLERDIYACISKLHPDAICSHSLDFYTVDIFIPSTNQVIEVQGDYWHSSPNQISKDRGKLLFLSGKGYKVHYIWEHEWNLCTDKELLISTRLASDSEETTSTVNVILVGGAAGTGKSWVCNQLLQKYVYVEYDKTPKKQLYNSIIDAAKSGRSVLVDIHTGISTFIRRAGGRFNIKLVILIESENELRQRLNKRGGAFTDGIKKRMARMEKLKQHPNCVFSGTSTETLDFLK